VIYCSVAISKQRLIVISLSVSCSLFPRMRVVCYCVHAALMCIIYLHIVLIFLYLIIHTMRCFWDCSYYLFNARCYCLLSVFLLTCFCVCHIPLIKYLV